MPAAVEGPKTVASSGVGRRSGAISRWRSTEPSVPPLRSRPRAWPLRGVGAAAPYLARRTTEGPRPLDRANGHLLRGVRDSTVRLAGREPFMPAPVGADGAALRSQHAAAPSLRALRQEPFVPAPVGAEAGQPLRGVGTAAAPCLAGAEQEPSCRSGGGGRQLLRRWAGRRLARRSSGTLMPAAVEQRLTSRGSGRRSGAAGIGLRERRRRPGSALFLTPASGRRSCASDERRWPVLTQIVWVRSAGFPADLGVASTVSIQTYV